MLSKEDLQQLCNTAERAAKEAGVFIQSQVNKPHVQQQKEGGHSRASQVVTEVDFKAQEIILHHLSPSLQQHDLGILTEEAVDDQSRLQKEYFWCIDPLDGTLPFTEQRPGYAVSIALIAQSGDPVIGVAYIPDEALCYSTIKGTGVRLNEQPYDLPKQQNDPHLHLYMDRSMQSDAYFQQLSKSLDNEAQANDYEGVMHHSGFGAVRNALAVLDHQQACYVKFPKEQQGGGSIWDFAATRLLLEELGLPVSNAKGERLHLNASATTFMHQQGVVYASNQQIHQLITQMRLD